MYFRPLPRAAKIGKNFAPCKRGVVDGLADIKKSKATCPPGWVALRTLKNLSIVPIWLCFRYDASCKRDEGLPANPASAKCECGRQPSPCVETYLLPARQFLLCQHRDFYRDGLLDELVDVDGVRAVLDRDGLWLGLVLEIVRQRAVCVDFSVALRVVGLEVGETLGGCPFCALCRDFDPHGVDGLRVDYLCVGRVLQRHGWDLWGCFLMASASGEEEGAKQEG